MAFYVWAALAAGLMALPIEVDVELDKVRTLGAHIRFKAAGASLGWTFALEKNADGYCLNVRKENSSNWHTHALFQMHGAHNAPAALAPAIKAALKHIMRNIAVRKLAIRARLGLGDAAASAMAAGLVCILAAGLCAVSDAPPEIDVQPDYAHTAFVLHAQGIFCLRLGHIIGAGLAGAGRFCKEALMQWTGKAILPRLRA